MPTYSNDVFWRLLFHEYSNTFYSYSNIFHSSSNICNRYSNALLLVDGVLLWVEGGVVGVDVAIDSHSRCCLDIGITCCGQMSSGTWRAEAREPFSQNAGPLKSLSPQYRRNNAATPHPRLSSQGLFAAPRVLFIDPCLPAHLVRLSLCGLVERAPLRGFIPDSICIYIYIL